MSEHSFIAPSSADKWLYCAGSPHLEAKFPGVESEDSREGDSVHGMIANCLRGQPMQQIGEVEPIHGLVITAEMYETAMVMVAEVTQTAGERDLTTADMHVEERIDCPSIHPSNFGAVDIWFHDHANNDLFVYDFKNGHGLIEAENNPQMLNYASGICLKLCSEYGQHYVSGLNVWLCIVQPRGFHREGPVRYWLAPPEDRATAWADLAEAADRVYGPDPQCTPGPHCKYCDGRRGCAAASNAAMFGADLATDAEPLDLTPEQLGIQLSILERGAGAIDNRITGLREQAKSMIKSGKNVTGYTVEPATGNLAWNVPLETCLAIEAMTGKDIKQPLKLITPTQAKNLGIDAELIKQFASRPSKGVKLVASDATAKRVFS